MPAPKRASSPALDDDAPELRPAVTGALGAVGSVRSVAPLLALMDTRAVDTPTGRDPQPDCGDPVAPGGRGGGPALGRFVGVSGRPTEPCRLRGGQTFA